MIAEIFENLFEPNSEDEVYARQKVMFPIMQEFWQRFNTEEDEDALVKEFEKKDDSIVWEAFISFMEGAPRHWVDPADLSLYEAWGDWMVANNK